MTNSQILELDLSAVQFEEVSDENASIIQGGTGDKRKDNGNGNGNDILLENLLESTAGFFTDLVGISTFDEYAEAAETWVEAVYDEELMDELDFAL